MSIGKTTVRTLVVLTVAAVAVIAYVRRPAADGEEAPAAQAALPRLLDLGADKCVPCKMMAPILEELRTEYDGRFEVVFVDVWKTPEAAREHGVRVIPTQIFYGADGVELFRHEGFFGREDILAKWTELGVDVTAGEG